MTTILKMMRAGHFHACPAIFALFHYTDVIFILYLTIMGYIIQCCTLNPFYNLLHQNQNVGKWLILTCKLLILPAPFILLVTGCPIRTFTMCYRNVSSNQTCSPTTWLATDGVGRRDIVTRTRVRVLEYRTYSSVLEYLLEYYHITKFPVHPSINPFIHAWHDVHHVSVHARKGHMEIQA